MPAIRVFIADDFQSVIDQFVSQFARDDNFAYSGSAKNPEQLKAQLSGKKDKIDVVLLDIFGTPNEFIELVMEINDMYPNLPVIVLSGTEDYLLVQRLIDQGVKAYLSKALSFDKITQCIQLIHNDPNMTIFYPPPPDLVDSDRDRVKQLLSPRELQVISLMCRGFKNNKEMAEFLTSINGEEIRELTVQTHRRNIRIKLRDYGVTNDTSLGFWIGKWDLLDGDELSSAST